MKQEWNAPQLEVLDVKETMLGPGYKFVDFTFSDIDEVGEIHAS
ncbi:paeninodin family lasso peptide [Gracilibacillus boraciitolerans]|nr:paeninodin family lasso peptide [Gracilibacillus boraciitolerans]